MTKQKKNWIIEQSPTPPAVEDLHPVTGRILAHRGLTDRQSVTGFFEAGLSDLDDPFLLKGMEQAVARIQQAVETGEQIVIYGDYDVDGLTATSLLFRFLQGLMTGQPDYYLPNRLEEGYGLNLEAIRTLTSQDYDLMITVDCGITAHRQVALAREGDLDVIITDHHQPGSSLPEARAIINPSLTQDYPFSELAGVGVAFKLCQALNQALAHNLSGLLTDLLELVALGTVADIVPLEQENRILVREGMDRLNRSQWPGIAALIDELGLQKVTTTGQIGYILAPPLNAAGRMSNPELGLELLVTDDHDRAAELAGKLVSLNRERQQEEKQILRQARQMVEEEIDLDREKAIVLASSDWHPGIIGIVASRLVDRYYRPTILIALEEGTGRGSARSISDLNLYQALADCRKHLLEYGGHAQAAGLEIEDTQIPAFKKAFNQYLDRVLSRKHLIQGLQLDAVVKPEDINFELYQELEAMKPFGVGNPRPRLLLNNVELTRSRTVGKQNQHLKIKLAGGLDGIGFDLGNMAEDIRGQRVDLACRLSLNRWNGRENLQLKIEDINLRTGDYFPVTFVGQELTIADKRGLDQHFRYIENLIPSSERMAVFLKHGKKCRYYSRLFQEGGIEAAILKQNRPFPETADLVFYTSPCSPEGVEPEFDRLLFLSLPFSLSEMANVIESTGVGNRPIHLVFGEEQFKINRKLLGQRLAGEDYLRRFYRVLLGFEDNTYSLKQLEELFSTADLSLNQYLLKNSLQILEELELLRKQGQRVKLLPVPDQKLDLSESVRYNKNIEIFRRFDRFSRLALSGDLFELIDELTKLLGGEQT